MCFMDWRIGRFIRVQQTFKTAAAAQSYVIPPNPSRIGLRIMAEATTLPTGIKIDSQNPADNQTCVALEFESKLFTVATDGDLPTRGMTVGSTGASGHVGGYIEYFAPEWLMRQGTEQLMKEIGNPPLIT